MNRLILLLVCLALPTFAVAQDSETSPQTAAEPAAEPGLIAPAHGKTLEDFQWLFRPIVVFADTKADPRFSQQMEQLQAGIAQLADRDVIILTDTDPALGSAARDRLRPRGFQFVLIGKDGRVLMRRPSPQSVREITRSIDKSPTRQREIEERRSQRSGR